MAGEVRAAGNGCHVGSVMGSGSTPSSIAGVIRGVAPMERGGDADPGAFIVGQTEFEGADRRCGLTVDEAAAEADFPSMPAVSG